jgi:Skp family chaperone for outer membrane proteins
MAAVGPKPVDPFAIFKEALARCEDRKGIEQSWQNSFVKVQNKPQVLQNALSNYREDISHYFNHINSQLQEISKSLSDREFQDLKQIVKKYQPDAQKLATGQEGKQLSACVEHLRDKIESIIEERDLLAQYKSPQKSQGFVLNLPPIKEEESPKEPGSSSSDEGR